MTAASVRIPAWATRASSSSNSPFHDRLLVSMRREQAQPIDPRRERRECRQDSADECPVRLGDERDRSLVGQQADDLTDREPLVAATRDGRPFPKLQDLGEILCPIVADEHLQKYRSDLAPGCREPPNRLGGEDSSRRAIRTRCTTRRPQCRKPMRGHDLLVSGHCPNCEKALTSLLLPAREQAHHRGRAERLR